MIALDWQQFGRGVGWIGGVLFLVELAERLAKRWIYDHHPEWLNMQRGRTGLPTLGPPRMVTRGIHGAPGASSFIVSRKPAPPPRYHTIICSKCGQNATWSPWGCTAPDAPTEIKLVHAPHCTCPQCAKGSPS